MVHDCVKTEKEAEKRLNEWFAQKENEGARLVHASIDFTNTECECGETMALMASYENCENIAIIGFCDCCGDDNALTSDVLELL